ncbi:MAG: ABC transporter permease [Planctomycetes bacterium]|nr:ABC transporter permease [Planctomycetota bacterium]
MTATPGPWTRAFARLRRDRAATASAVFLALLVCVCAGAGWVETPRADFKAIHLAGKLRPPSEAHWMGTDSLGRDVMARVLAGGRLSLGIGVVSACVALSLGVLYGAHAGWHGGRTDAAMMRFVDLVDSMPYMFLVIFLVSVFDRSLLLLFLALGATQWLNPARIVRAQVLSLRNADFVQAARSLGARGPAIFARHLLPNLAGVVVVYLTLTIPRVILFESFLSFLGLGARPPDEVSWGMLMADGIRQVNPVDPRWWVIVFPGGVLAATLLALNFLGDGLRDALDPRAERL